jgi:hypothetical protein
MGNEWVFRIIAAGLFLATWGVRRYYERQAAKVAEKGLVQDRDNRVITVLQSLLLTVSLIALLVYIIYPQWLRWSIIDFAGVATMDWGGAGGHGSASVSVESLCVGEQLFRRSQDSGGARVGASRTISMGEAPDLYGIHSFGDRVVLVDAELGCRRAMVGEHRPGTGNAGESGRGNAGRAVRSRI